jgi:hypothetical protein
MTYDAESYLEALDLTLRKSSITFLPVKRNPNSV